MAALPETQTSSQALASEPTATKPATLSRTSTLSARTSTLAGGSTTATASDPLFSLERLPRPLGLEADRLLLSLPGSIVELAFVPVIPVLVAMERYHVVERVIDLITNDELTFAAAPIIEPFNTSGLGFGAVALWNAPLGSPDRIIALGLVRLNGDRSLSLTVGRRLPPLSGRVLNFAANYEVDRDIGWFGLGSNQDLNAQRLLRRDELAASVGLSELFPSTINIDGGFDLGYRRRGLFSGSGTNAPILTAEEGLSLPPGFGRTIDYLEANVRFRYDTRDGLGRTTRGIVWSIAADGSRQIGPEDGELRSGGLRLTSQFTWFFPILPRFRVLVLSAGVSAATPIFEGDEVALHQLVNLGGANTLRGYQPDRFLDEMGWWGTAEYRFLLSDYGGSILGFSGSVFADIGKVGPDVDALISGTVPWSVGIGIRAETDILLLGRVQVAVSPDGVRFSVGVGEFF